MRKLAVATLVTAMGAVSAGASAAVIGTVADADTQSFTMPSGNDFGDLSGATGEIGATAVSTVSGALSLTFEFLFKEAGYNNAFYFNGIELFSNNGSSFGDTATVGWSGSGALDFAFLAGPTMLANADNDGSQSLNFFTYFDDVGRLYLALDDNGVDDDHDDMVIRVTGVESQVADVSEPGTIALLGLGVLGLSLARRRSAKAAH